MDEAIDARERVSVHCNCKFLESNGLVDGYQEEGTSLLDDTLYLKDTHKGYKWCSATIHVDTTTQLPPLELEPQGNSECACGDQCFETRRRENKGLYVWAWFIAVVQPFFLRSTLRHPLSVAIFHPSMWDPRTNEVCNYDGSIFTALQ